MTERETTSEGLAPFSAASLSVVYHNKCRSFTTLNIVFITRLEHLPGDVLHDIEGAVDLNLFALQRSGPALSIDGRVGQRLK